MACLVLDVLLLALQTLRSLICGGKSLYLIYSISMCTFSVPPMVIGSSSACPQSLRGEAWLPSAELTGPARDSVRPGNVGSGRCTSLMLMMSKYLVPASPRGLLRHIIACLFSAFVGRFGRRRQPLATAGLGSDSCRSFSCSLFRLLGCSNATSSDQSKSVAVLPRKKSLCL